MTDKHGFAKCSRRLGSKAEGLALSQVESSQIKVNQGKKMSLPRFCGHAVGGTRKAKIEDEEEDDYERELQKMGINSQFCRIQGARNRFDSLGGWAMLCGLVFRRADIAIRKFTGLAGPMFPYRRLESRLNPQTGMSALHKRILIYG